MVCSLFAGRMRCGIDRKTVARWKKRTSVADLATGPKRPYSTVPSLEEEAIVAFRRHAPLPPGGHLHALRAVIPHPTQ